MLSRPIHTSFPMIVSPLCGSYAMYGRVFFVHAPPNLLLQQTVIFQTERDLVGAVDGKKLAARVLKNRSRQLADLANGQPRGVPSVQAAEARQRALVKLWDQPVDAPQQRRFAAATAATEHHTAPRRDASGGFLQSCLFFLRVLKCKLKIDHNALFSAG